MVENLRGNARIVGADTDLVTAKAHTTVRAYNQPEAERANNQCPFEVVRNGDMIVVRSNHDRLSGSARVSTDMEITVPKGASIDARGRYGDFDVHGVDGTVTVDSDNAGVRLGNLGGNVKVDTRKGDIVRAIGVKGSVEVRGANGDLELESIEGPVVVNGSYYGDIVLRKIAKPARFESSVSDMRFPKINGHVEISRGELRGQDIAGPVYLRTRSRDIHLSDFTDAVEIQIERGDVDLRPGKLPVGKMDVHVRGGNVVVAVPDGAKFEINASTDKGGIENDLNNGLRRETHNRGARLAGSTGGGGPMLNLRTDRGNIALRRGSVLASQTPGPVERQ